MRGVTSTHGRQETSRRSHGFQRRERRVSGTRLLPARIRDRQSPTSVGAGPLQTRIAARVGPHRHCWRSTT